MKKNEITVAQKFDMVIRALQGSAQDTDLSTVELMMFISDRKEKSMKKSSGEKDKEKAEADAKLMDSICEFLADGAKSATDIGGAIGVSTPKAVAMLKKLQAAGRVVRFEDKKKVTFALATE